MYVSFVRRLLVQGFFSLRAHINTHIYVLYNVVCVIILLFIEFSIEAIRNAILYVDYIIILPSIYIHRFFWWWPTRTAKTWPKY